MGYLLLRLRDQPVLVLSLAGRSNGTDEVYPIRRSLRRGINVRAQVYVRLVVVGLVEIGRRRR